VLWTRDAGCVRATAGTLMLAVHSHSCGVQHRQTSRAAVWCTGCAKPQLFGALAVQNHSCVQVFDAVAAHKGLTNRFAAAETIYRVTERLFFPHLMQMP
jgi:hypothetical protein